MDKELYIGVDVSKKTLDLAYYDGEHIDWKNAHIKVTNDDAGFKQVASWVAKVGKNFDTILFCMEYTGLYNQNFRLILCYKKLNITCFPLIFTKETIPLHVLINN